MYVCVNVYICVGLGNLAVLPLCVCIVTPDSLDSHPIQHFIPQQNLYYNNNNKKNRPPGLRSGSRGPELSKRRRACLINIDDIYERVHDVRQPPANDILMKSARTKSCVKLCIMRGWGCGGSHGARRWWSACAWGSFVLSFFGIHGALFSTIKHTTDCARRADLMMRTKIILRDDRGGALNTNQMSKLREVEEEERREEGSRLHLIVFVYFAIRLLPFQFA